jgi:hypothetical protein
VVVAKVVGEDALEVPLVEHDGVIQALASDGGDQPFHERILPRGARRDHDLLGGPFGGRAGGDIEVEDAPSLVSENEEDEEDLVAPGRQDEEVGRDDVADVVLQECTPSHGWGLPAADHVSLDGRLVEIDADLGQFTDDPGCTPSGLAIDILRIRSRISLWIAGLPGFRDRLSLAQCCRNFLRRQAMTVSGLTITKASRQPDQARESQAQRMRSEGFSLGRAEVRW